MKLIPFDPSLSAYQDFSVNLGEYVCNFRFLWNERDKAWYVDFESLNGSLNGVKLVVGSNLFKDSYTDFLDGNFRVLKITKTARKLCYDNFGTEYKLVFGTSSEWRVFNGV